MKIFQPLMTIWQVGKLVDDFEVKTVAILTFPPRSAVRDSGWSKLGFEWPGSKTSANV
jgi:hypothetical protein